MLKSEHADRDERLDTVDIVSSSSLHESVSLAASWPHQSPPQRLPLGERALLGRAVERPDLSDAAQLKSDSSPAADPAPHAAPRCAGAAHAPGELPPSSSSAGQLINAGSGGSDPAAVGLPGLGHRPPRASSRSTDVRPLRSPTTSRSVSVAAEPGRRGDGAIAAHRGARDAAPPTRADASTLPAPPSSSPSCRPSSALVQALGRTGFISTASVTWPVRDRDLPKKG